MNHRIFVLLICISLPLILSNCREKHKGIDNAYKYYSPRYDVIGLQGTTDTISFFLDDSTFLKIGSMNVFEQNGKSYLSIFDKLSRSVNIYEIGTQRLVKRMDLTKYFDKKKLYRSTIHIKNFDSLFISCNSTSLYIMDTSGRIKKSIDFPNPGYSVTANFDNTAPAVFKDGRLYTGIRISGIVNTLEKMRKWKPVYEFDLKKGNALLHYTLPNIYLEDIYNFLFLSYGYCYNDHGKFVFSFAADTNIYETDLADYNIAYYGKSRFQTDDIMPSKNGKTIYKQLEKDFVAQSLYGPIYFDPYTKRYLRIAKSKLDASLGRRREYVIIFDEQFRIIGESEPESKIQLGNIIFAGGCMYAGISSADEHALHFVRLAYTEKPALVTQNGKQL